MHNLYAWKGSEILHEQCYLEHIHMHRQHMLDTTQPKEHVVLSAKSIFNSQFIFKKKLHCPTTSWSSLFLILRSLQGFLQLWANPHEEGPAFQMGQQRGSTASPAMGYVFQRDRVLHMPRWASILHRAFVLKLLWENKVRTRSAGRTSTFCSQALYDLRHSISGKHSWPQGGWPGGPPGSCLQWLWKSCATCSLTLKQTRVSKWSQLAPLAASNTLPSGTMQ